MAAAPALESRPTPETTALDVERPGRVDARFVVGLLSDAGWLGERQIGGAEDGWTRYLTDLVLPLPPEGRLLSLRKAAIVDVGPAAVAAGACEIPIAWRSASLAPLFPVFAGHLVIRPGGMAIRGHYAPPGGAIGVAADRLLLGVAARGTARWFLGRVAEAAGAAIR